MKAKSLLFLFGLAVLLQLAVPASMILKREHALTHGRAFKFRTAPVDPYDAFRGRFVALGFDPSHVRVAPDHDFRRNETVHALLAEDAEGYALFSGISRSRPLAEPYLDLKIQNVLGGDIYLRPPFDRFYMEESEAPDAERAYRQNSVRSNRNAYVQVRIEKGFGVIEDLYVDDTPIRKYLDR
jgi:uncharacterized membrane-anchored protein